MKKRHLLLTLGLAVTFACGFIAGVFVKAPDNSMKQSTAPERKLGKVPESAKTPGLKIKPRSKSHQANKVLIGYLQDFRSPDVVDYDKLTYVNFSFAHPTADGRVLLNGKMAIDHLRVVVSKAHQHGTKIMLAVGGWYNIQGGESYKYFKPAISDPTSRSKLVDELESIAVREQLDGIDIDFEHPRSQEDAQNLAAFTKDLSVKLHNQHKELSIAVHAKINSNTGTEANYVVYDPAMFQFVDHVNIMAYDGQWDGAYNAANLSPYPITEKIVNYWATLFEKNNLPKEKLVLGVPSYGQPENPSIKQVSYAAIIGANPANADRDSVNMNGTTYYYNGEQTIKRKTKLALDNDFGGMMLWETGLDATGPNSITGTVSAVLKDSEKDLKKQIAEAK